MLKAIILLLALSPISAEENHPVIRIDFRASRAAAVFDAIGRQSNLQVFYSSGVDQKVNITYIADGIPLGNALDDVIEITNAELRRQPDFKFNPIRIECEIRNGLILIRSIKLDE